MTQTIRHRGRHVFDAVSSGRYEGGGLDNTPFGDHFYVDPTNGSSGNPGKSKGAAKATLAQALALCTDWKGDVIHVARGTQTVTATIDVSKKGVTIIADDLMAEGSNGEYHAILADAAFTDGPVMTITQPCNIIGLGFAGRDTGATFWSGASVLIGGLTTALPFGVYMALCRFPKWGLDARIGLSIEGSSNCRIEGCDFEGALRAGIYVQGATQHLVIKGNRFQGNTAAVLLGAFAGGGPTMILGPDNIVKGGYLLETDANTAEGQIIGNYSDLAVGNAYDRTVTQLKAQGLDPIGNHYLEAN